MKKCSLLIIAVIQLLCFSVNATSKAFTVKIYGKGTPMILIPGYTCSGDVWDETVKRFSGKYECHVLTLAGFAGVPAVAEPSLTKVKDEIVDYVKEKKMKQTVLLGHSLGGMMALWLSSTEPDLFSKVIVVDALPFYSLLYGPTATVESSKPYADMAKTNILNALQTEASAKQNLKAMITDSVNIHKAAMWSVASDKNTMAQYIYDLMTTDLRNELPKIKAPVLVLGSWSATKAYGGSKEATEKNYINYYKGIANCKVIIAEKAKHFIMFDEPQWFLSEVETFLK